MPNTQTKPERFATTSFVAHLAGVSTQTVRNYIERGTIAPDAFAHPFGEKPIALFSAANLNATAELIRAWAHSEPIHGVPVSNSSGAIT